MRRPTLVIFPLFLAVSSVVFSQVKAAPYVKRDPQAIEHINHALAAMGGQAAWSAVLDTTVSGTCVLAARQGGGATLPFRWTTAQDEFRYETDTDNQGPVMLSGHGNPSIASSTNNRAVTHETATLLKPYHLPGEVLLSALTDLHYSINTIGNDAVHGLTSIHLRIVHYLTNTSELGSTQDWWLDATTYLPTKVTYNVPGQQVEAYMPITYLYSAWGSEESGILIPHQLSQYEDSNVPMQTCAITKLKINTHPISTFFDER
jgi:hypothetical protein